MKLSIIGTGFISKAFLSIADIYKDVEIQYILTRRKISDITDFPYHRYLTNDIHKIFENSDIVFECSGDPKYALMVCTGCSLYDIPVATMNSEFHITYGSDALKQNNKLYITECQGDQPGSFISFMDEIKGYGFTPKIFLNFKRFLNINPIKEEMIRWSKRQNISLPQVIAATDGTKVQIEQCLIANWLGLDIIKQDMVGIRSPDLDSIIDNTYKNKFLSDKKYCDYVLCNNIPKGIGIISEHSPNQHNYLNYYGLGDGPNYLLYKPFHLCHLEVIHTIRNLYWQRDILLNNTKDPIMNVYAICKTKIPKGTKINKAIGSFEFRGSIGRIKENVDNIPIGKLENYITVNELEPNQMVSYSDVEKI